MGAHDIREIVFVLILPNQSELFKFGAKSKYFGKLVKLVLCSRSEGGLRKIEQDVDVLIFLPQFKSATKLLLGSGFCYSSGRPKSTPHHAQKYVVLPNLVIYQ